MAKLKIRKEILWTLLVVVLIAAIIIPIIIVYTAAEQDNGNRIACFPLMEKDNDEKLESVCNEKGCIYDAVAENVKCYLPLSGSKSYGYEVIYFKQERKSRLFYSFFFPSLFEALQFNFYCRRWDIHRTSSTKTSRYPFFIWGWYRQRAV